MVQICKEDQFAILRHARQNYLTWLYGDYVLSVMNGRHARAVQRASKMGLVVCIAGLQSERVILPVTFFQTSTTDVIGAKRSSGLIERWRS